MADGGSSAQFKLTPKQVQANRLLAGRQTHTMLVGGSRSAKTFTLVRALCVRALRAPESRHVIFRLRYNALRASIWLDTLPKVMRLCFPGVKLKDARQDGFVEFPNASQLWFGGLDEKERVEKILGQEYATTMFNECSQIPYGSVLTGLTRLAQKVDGLQNRAYYDLNPVGTGHWTHRLFIEGIDPVDRHRLEHPEDYRHLFMNPVDNAANIDPAYLARLKAMPERMRRRFLEGRYVAEIDGALWSIEMLEGLRWDEPVPDLRRIVVAIDPSGCAGKEDKRSDEVGIVVAGVHGDGENARGYVLEDCSGRYSPEGWAKVACAAFHRWNADAVIGETNYGGDMVRAVVHGADRNVPFKMVTASRGKAVRAEPVSALYEQGRVYHVGSFAQLEDQMCNFSVSGYQGDRSPDRADACVWALTDLMLGKSSTGLLEYYREMGMAQMAAQDKGRADYDRRF